MQSSGGFLLDLLILATYLRYSDQIDNGLAREAITILTTSQCEEEDEAKERLQAQRRHDFYVEMANQQINDAIAALMTISVVRKSTTTMQDYLETISDEADVNLDINDSEGSEAAFYHAH